MSTTEVIPYNINPLPVRIDKNFAFHISSFKDLFAEDAKLLKAVIFYMAINFQDKDLFGFYKLDPKDFADKLKFNKPLLFSIHKNPFFMTHDVNAEKLLFLEEKHGRNSEYRTWKTVLENALYILTNKSFIDDYRIREQGKTVVETERFNFIDKIRFEHIKTGKTKKIVYYYKPNPLFEQNLKTYFIGTFTEHFVALRKSNLEEAYLNLLNRINNRASKGFNSIEFSIDTIATLLNINKYKEFSLYKRKVTSKFKKLKISLDQQVKELQLTWIKPTSTTAVSNLIESIVIPNKNVKYDNIALISWESYTKEETYKRNEKVYNNIFDVELNRKLIESYFNTHQGKLLNFDEEIKKASFYKWIFSLDEMNIKSATYISCYIEIKKNNKNIEYDTSFFLKSLVYISQIQKKYDCFKLRRNQIVLSLKDKKIVFNHFYEIINHFSEQYNSQIDSIPKSRITF